MNFSGEGANQSGTPFISTYRVSITTISEIRYEGTLYQVNPEKKNIVLTNVVSFGTEGKMPNNEILGSNVVHESIVFEGKDIKDLVVLDSSAEQFNNNPQNNQNVPEIAQTENKQVNQTIEETKKECETKKPIEEQKKNEVLDFQLMNEKFQKLTMKDAKSNEKEFGKYIKTSFFDNISNSTVEKTRESKEERFHQNQVDKETFGSDSLLAKRNQKYPKNNQNYKYRGYRGGHRGDYNRNYNDNLNNNLNYNYKYNNNNEGVQSQSFQPRHYNNEEGGQSQSYQPRHYNNEEGGQSQSFQQRGHYNQNYEGGKNYESGSYRNGGYRQNYKSSNQEGGYYSGAGPNNNNRGGIGYQTKYQSGRSGPKNF